MPRIARAESVGGIYHVINRGNMQMQVFDDAEDYEYFLKLLHEGLKKEAVELHAYCLMPNHFHLLLVSKAKGSLSRFMQWVMTSHVRYYHKKNKTSGHVWQKREAGSGIYSLLKKSQKHDFLKFPFDQPLHVKRKNDLYSKIFKNTAKT
jgi:putative transposase